MANQYDTAYLVGYSSGYHGDKYNNEYCRFTEAQLHVKYEHGYEDGVDIRTREGLTDA